MAASGRIDEDKKGENTVVGHASSPDALKIYGASNQEIWLQRSKEIKGEFRSKLNSFQNFYELYSFLAGKRKEVAKELKHREDEGITEDFGRFRTESVRATEDISNEEIEQAWKNQKNKIFELTRELVKNVKGEEYQDDFILCYADHSQEGMTSYDIMFKAKPEETKQSHSQFLSTIEFLDFSEEKEKSFIRITYTNINKNSIKGDFEIADKYYQALRAWKPENGIEEFLTNAGKLAHIMAHVLPVRLGNSSIVEWVITGLAEDKNINLGPFNYAEGIGWDLKALLTPDRDKYAEWFKQKAFALYKKVDAPSFFDSSVTDTLAAQANKKIEVPAERKAPRPGGVDGGAG